MNPEFHIMKINESQAYIACEPSIAQELWQALRFRPPGYMFSPKFKKKQWDGWISLYNRQNGRIAMGLVPKAAAVLSDIGARGKVDPEVAKCFINPKYNKEAYEEWESSLILTDDRGRMIESVWDHQREAALEIIKKKRRTIISPTSSGKSLQIYLAARWILDNDPPEEGEFLLITVPTIMLVEQFTQSFQDYSQKDPSFDAEKEVHAIGDGRPRDHGDSRVIISTWQSVMHSKKDWRRRAICLFHDECHNTKGKELQNIAQDCSSARYRGGFTGTLDGTEVHQLVAESCYGPVKTVATLRDLISSGIISEPTIINVVMNYPREDREVLKLADFQAEYKFAKGHQRRANVLAQVVAECGTDMNVLVLCRHKDHLKKTYEAVKKISEETGQKVFMRSGDDSLDDRDEVKKVMERSSGNVLVATYGILSTGVSIRNLHVGILGSPNKSRIANLQSIGRLLRTTDTKDRAVVVDIIDDTTHYTKVGKRSKKECYLMDQFLTRAKIYAEEDIRYVMRQVDVVDGLTEPLKIQQIYEGETV